MKINLGCGQNIREGEEWINVDIELPEPKENYEKKIFLANMTDLPEEWEDQAEEIVCEGALEHLGFDDVKIALSEMRRVLKPGGLLVIQIPDLDYVTEMYCSAKDDTVLKSWAAFMIYGIQVRPGQYHRSGYSVKSFQDLLNYTKLKVINIAHIWRYTQRMIHAECSK